MATRKLHYKSDIAFKKLEKLEFVGRTIYSVECLVNDLYTNDLHQDVISN